MSSIKIKKRKERRREGKEIIRKERTCLKYSLIYALKNFNRFSKLMNLNTHIYKHEIKHETSKSSFQRRSIGIYRFFFFFGDMHLIRMKETENDRN